MFLHSEQRAHKNSISCQTKPVCLYKWYSDLLPTAGSEGLNLLSALYVYSPLTMSNNYSTLAPWACRIAFCAVRTNLCRCYTVLTLPSRYSHSPLPTWRDGDDTHTRVHAWVSQKQKGAAHTHSSFAWAQRCSEAKSVSLWSSLSSTGSPDKPRVIPAWRFFWNVPAEGNECLLRPADDRRSLVNCNESRTEWTEPE